MLITPSRSARTHPLQVCTWGDLPALGTTGNVIGTEIETVMIAMNEVIEATTEIATVTAIAAPDQAMVEVVSAVWVGRGHVLTITSYRPWKLLLMLNIMELALTTIQPDMCSGLLTCT